MKIDTSKMSIADIVAQKKTIIQSKKQLPIYSEPLIFGVGSKIRPSVIHKQEEGEEVDDPNKLKVTVVGNTALWCDSHMDVLSTDSYDKTVKEQGLRVPLLHDHIHELTGKLGRTLKLYTQIMQVEDFGITSDVKETRSLLMDAELLKLWDPKIFQMYLDKEVDQHSIGLQYVKLDLAVKNDEFPEEFAIWEKAFPQVINKEKVLKRGFFWWVTEIKLFEISAVLFGSNELTPTLDSSKTNLEPGETTLEKIPGAGASTPAEEADKVTSDIEKRKRILLQNS